MLNLRFLFLLLIAVCSFSNIANADEGQPVAIRHWPGGGFTVESMWDLHVGVGLDDENKKLLPRQVDTELEKLPGLKGSPCTLFRNANSDEVKLIEESKDDDSNRMLLSISKEYETKDHRDARPLSSFTVIDVDGVQVQFLDHDRMKMDRRMEMIKKGGGNKEVQKGFVVVAAGDQFTADFCKKYAEYYKPILMVVNASIKQVGESKVKALEHNTLAVSNQDTESKATQFVSLGTEPYKMSDELKDLFAKKEVSQKASREMFAKLSVAQMNFKPNNGSHTPRWNTEHMMGRELVFFSQIYNAVDPSIPVMNINPKQMPKDYEFAHPDWTGKEEAQQMKRVENFTRRFAHLLDGMDLDKRAKGSRIWTPRRLLIQMENHYTEHSANVVKKMELDGWPEK